MVAEYLRAELGEEHTVNFQLLSQVSLHYAVGLD